MALIKRKTSKPKDLLVDNTGNSTSNSDELLVNSMTNPIANTIANPNDNQIANQITNNSNNSFTPTKVFNDHVENIANAINETSNSGASNSNELLVNPSANNSPSNNSNQIANGIGNNSNESIVNQIVNQSTKPMVDSQESTGGLPAIEDMLNEVKKGREELVKSQTAITPEIDPNFTQSAGAINDADKAKFNFESMNNIIV